MRPPGGSFVIGDRPVFWGFEGELSVAPNLFRHPMVQLFAPLTRSIMLFAHHAEAPPPAMFSYQDINRVTASAAREWIAGATRGVVADALGAAGKGSGLGSKAHGGAKSWEKRRSGGESGN